MTAIDHLRASGAGVRVVLVSGTTTLLTAPNTTAAHTFAAAVAAVLTPVEARRPAFLLMAAWLPLALIYVFAGSWMR